MLELKHDALEFSFPEVHPDCRLQVEFQRTLRIPDDGKDYPLPPGLGRFSLRHVDDFAERVPDAWKTRGGVMFPMHETEAMWLNFTAPIVAGHGVSWPFALKVAAGKINAVDGEQWTNDLHQRRGEQDYLAIPEQPWLDGFYAGKGAIRQFVAMTLGRGYTVEEQLTGAAEHGGVQLVAYPMKRDEFLRRFPKRPPMRRSAAFDGPMPMSAPMPCPPDAAMDMGLGAGGRMQQEILDDPFGVEVYDAAARSRCFVHLCNAMVWRSVTGDDPAHPPPTAADYERAGMPWFDFTTGKPHKSGSNWLDKVKTVLQVGAEKGEPALPENESIVAKKVVTLKSPDGVSDGEW